MKNYINHFVGQQNVKLVMATSNNIFVNYFYNIKIKYSVTFIFKTNDVQLATKLFAHLR